MKKLIYPSLLCLLFAFQCGCSQEQESAPQAKVSTQNYELPNDDDWTSSESETRPKASAEELERKIREATAQFQQKANRPIRRD